MRVRIVLFSLWSVLIFLVCLEASLLFPVSADQQTNTNQSVVGTQGVMGIPNQQQAWAYPGGFITPPAQYIQPQPVQQSPWSPEGVLIFVGLGIITVLLAIVAYLGKRQIDCVLTKLDTVNLRQSDCREGLTGRFADKYTTAADLKELYARTDKHEAALQRFSVMISGRRATDGLAISGQSSGNITET